MFLLMVAMFMLALFQPNFAFAQAGDLNNSPISRGLCNVFELAGGNIGKAIAIFAIVAVGFGFFTGKFSIALVIGITLGVGILFGAPKIISALTGTDAVDCNSVGTGDDIPCPFKVQVVGGALEVSNSSNNITLTSNSMNLARISCAVASTDKTDIRPQLTPLTSSSQSRSAAVSGGSNAFFSSANGGGTIATTGINNSSAVSLTTGKITADIIFTVGANGFCPGIQDTLTYYASACSAGVMIAVSSNGTSVSGVLCATASGLGVAASNPISGTNVTHSGSFASGSAGGKVIIKPGFLGDIRTYALGTRKIIATCTSGNWVLATDSTVAPSIASATNTLAVPADSGGATPVTIEFTP